MPAVKLGLFVLRLFTARLGDQLFGFANAMAQSFLPGLAQRAHLARDFAVQAAQYGDLAFDLMAHVPELACVGEMPRLVAQQLALFCMSLLELDVLGLGRFDQCQANGLHQLAVGRVSDGFILHGGVNNELAELFIGDQLRGNGHFNGASQEFLNTFFAQLFAELEQLYGFARPAVLKVLIAKKVLPSVSLSQSWMRSSPLSLKAYLR